MKRIQPNSPELREIKAKAIVSYDVPLLEQIQEVEGKEFIHCETFLDLLQASSIEENDLPIVEGTELTAVFKQFSEGD